MIPMTYYKSEEFPWMGAGGINPMAGPVYHASDQPHAKNPFPEYFENKLFLYEWMRDWIYVITLDDNHNYVKADAFMPNTEFSHPMDMIFGSDGKMYVLEYGQKWNSQNLDARLSSITYLAGNREPIAKIANSKSVGAAPLSVNFTGDGSLDYDKDVLTYEWYFDSNEVQSTEVNPAFTFEKDGIYNVRLKVTDTEGNSAMANTKILVGNDPPTLTIKVTDNDSLYTKNKEIDYQIIVTDKQDGSTTDGSIDSDRVKVTFDYIAEGKDIVKAAIGHQRDFAAEGKLAIEGSDCKACHAATEKVNGPSYVDIAKKYAPDKKGYLVSKVIKGGGGVWGENAMSAHPQLSVEEVSLMIDYILSLKPDNEDQGKSLPLKGTLTFDQHQPDNKDGIYILMASYGDKGNPNQPDSELTVKEQFVFKNENRKSE